MKLFSRIVVPLFIVVAIIGCASSTITSRQQYQGGKIARPDHIIVYDFAGDRALDNVAIRLRYCRPIF